jgi:hypothetical protein
VLVANLVLALVGIVVVAASVAAMHFREVARITPMPNVTSTNRRRCYEPEAEGSVPGGAAPRWLLTREQRADAGAT